MPEEFSAEIRELIDTLAKTSRKLQDELQGASFTGKICGNVCHADFMAALKKVCDTTEDFEESTDR